MSLELVRPYIRGRGAVNIAQGVEAAIRESALAPDARLPTIRELARALSVSPTTVASAYRTLQARGVVFARGRLGTRVSYMPNRSARRLRAPVRGLRNLADGNPDPALLPNPSRAVRHIDPSPCLYGVETQHEGLARLARSEFDEAGVAAGPTCIVHGAMDAIDRLFAEHLRPGDRVAVEDPGFTGVHDLAISRGLSLLPVRLDDEGPLPESLREACSSGASAFVVTPRAQSPTGCTLSSRRARTLRRVLSQHPDLLIIEDDHASWISAAPLRCLHSARRRRWANVRSLSKSINPDLRLALMTGAEETVARVRDRMIVAQRWVSHILQRLAHRMLSDRKVRSQMERAAKTYARRRERLLEALAAHGVSAHGRSSYNVWIPVVEETATVQALAERGWAICPGERFRLSSAPAVRITASTLRAEEAGRLAADVATVLRACGDGALE